ncbi:molybdenum ABC transporter ATP-binding protein ModC [Conservatibacter flavescens]|uniref:Molybdenum ABC transporter ATP-binding protein n=1 Tax=Conservatibacter flavescens TaxID=28161 RepID=A0A2M8S3X8_9PAST|nr:molybdenum ABC transporter ATP-binding protein ModC [Conservatibacter flavescens]PJG85853.1 molybdenum ABC transporter ATP-binding protein [Conservatibacter flavescens]
MLRINVKQRLGNLLLEADLTLPSRGITAIFGLSGSGKSSLINLVSGLTKPDSGVIYLNNRVLVDEQSFVPSNRRNIGYVFQDARLFPHYSVKGNLRYGMKNSSQTKFDHVVELLGIKDLLHRYPLTLSGGEKQRVAIGRALLSEPEILLMDEPLSALDLPRKRELLNYLEKLTKEIDIPILYVTHSIDELLRLAENVVLMENGKVKAYDTLENMWNSPLFATWKQQENEQSAVISLPIFYHHPVYNMTALQLSNEQKLWVNAIPADIGSLVRLCIRSTDVSLALSYPEKSSIRNILNGIVTAIEIQDNRVDVQVEVANYRLWATISKWSLQDLQLIEGQPVYVQIKAVSVLS